MKRRRKPRLLRQRRPYRAPWLGWDHLLKKAYGPALLRRAGAMVPLKTPLVRRVDVGRAPRGWPLSYRVNVAP